MSAPIGNKYYLERSKNGPYKEFTPDTLWEAFEEYKNHIDKDPWYTYEAIKSGENAGQLIPIPHQKPYTIEGFASYIGLTFQGLKNYGTKEGYEGTFEVYTRIEGQCKVQKFAGASIGAFNANIIARDLGLVDKSDLTSGGEKLPVPPSVIEYKLVD